MDEVLLGWTILFFIFAWRWFCKNQAVQDKLHSPGMNKFLPLRWMLQWSTLLMVAFGWLCFRTFMDVVRFDYLHFHMLAPDAVHQQRSQIQTHTNGTQLDEEALSLLLLPDILRKVSLGAPPCGVLAYLLGVWQTINIVKRGATIKASEGSPRIFRASKRQNMVMMVMVLPVVFTVYAMRAQIRVWAVMTGSSWIPYGPGGRLNHVEVTWDQIMTAEMTTQGSDIALANFFQLQTVGAFGLLVMSYLKDVPRKYRNILMGVGMLGLWCYLAIATICFAADFYKSLLAAAEAQMRNRGNTNPVPHWVQNLLMMNRVTSEGIEDRFIQPIQPMNLAFTLLCVANMFRYERMEEIERHLGEATVKFNATKLLLIITHVQPVIIHRLPTIPFLQEHIFHGWHPSSTCQALIHTSLLPYECLIVVIANGLIWGVFRNKVDDRFFRYLPHRAAEEHAKQPLLQKFECLTEDGVTWVPVTVKPAEEQDKNKEVDVNTLRVKQEKTGDTLTCRQKFVKALYPQDDTDVSEDEDGCTTEYGKNHVKANIQLSKQSASERNVLANQVAPRDLA